MRVALLQAGLAHQPLDRAPRDRSAVYSVFTAPLMVDLPGTVKASRGVVDPANLDQHMLVAHRSSEYLVTLAPTRQQWGRAGHAPSSRDDGVRIVLALLVIGGALMMLLLGRVTGNRDPTVELVAESC